MLALALALGALTNSPFPRWRVVFRCKASVYYGVGRCCALASFRYQVPFAGMRALWTYRSKPKSGIRGNMFPLPPFSWTGFFSPREANAALSALVYLGLFPFRGKSHPRERTSPRRNTLPVFLGLFLDPLAGSARLVQFRLDIH